MSTQTERPPDMGFVRPRPVVDDDEPFRQSLADLKRQLAARGEHRRPASPPHPDLGRADVERVHIERADIERVHIERAHGARAAAQRAKVEQPAPPEPTRPARRTRRRRPYLLVMALVLGIGLAALYRASQVAPPPEPPQPQRSVATFAPPPPNPAPQPRPAEIAPPARVTVDPPPPTMPVVVTASEPPAARPKGKLEAYEIMEIQTRLKAIGLNPGTLDGLSGPQTTSAIKQYEASKGRPQTGKPDREVLKLLRQEPDRGDRR